MNRLLVVMVVVGGAAACGDDDDDDGDASPDPGALVEVTMQSSVGVLLDELPMAARDALAADLLVKPVSFWEERARRQVRASLYRLVYRNFYHDPGTKGQLPLPPEELWELTMAAPRRLTIDGHDLVLSPYGFRGMLLAAADEPGRADEALDAVGGVVEEAFVLPADPEHLLERTGFACMNESDFPPNSVDTENAAAFFDDTCEGGDAEDGCHVTLPAPTATCVEALEASVGRVEATFRFERLPWDGARAGAVRVGDHREGGPQLAAVQAGLEDHRIVYRYFPADACALVEGCVTAPGWRRLLQFTATMHNVGDEDAALGDVGPESIIVANNLVSPSDCHGHMHFNHYGRFALGSDANLGSKRAFCLESTSRYFNNETTPLVHPYSCEFQGTARGWGDDYIAGLDCQWIDITSVNSTGGVSETLTFEVNPDEFLCEGALVLDDDGVPQFEPTEFTNEQGVVENRFQCEPFADAAADNTAMTTVTVPETGGLVTEPCARFVVGPTRNCGFQRAPVVVTCAPGATTTVHCAGGSGDAPAAVRVCEASHLLGLIPCTYREALASITQQGTGQDVTFTCPAARSTAETGGLASVFIGPLVDGDDVTGVSCTMTSTQ